MLKNLAKITVGGILVCSLMDPRGLFQALDKIEFEKFYDDVLVEQVEKIRNIDYNQLLNDISGYLGDGAKALNDAAKEKSGKTDKEDKTNAYIFLNDNMPDFTDAEIKNTKTITYAELDSLGRAGQVTALINEKTLPIEAADKIGTIKPTGWKTVKYDDKNYLYTRHHLLSYDLGGENTDMRNLVTGTNYMHTELLQPIEDELASYINSGGSVLYRVTPVYEDDNLVCSGIQIEAYSLDDDGESICLNVFAMNVQPGVNIDYTTGECSSAQ